MCGLGRRNVYEYRPSLFIFGTVRETDQEPNKRYKYMQLAAHTRLNTKYQKRLLCLAASRIQEQSPAAIYIMSPAVSSSLPRPSKHEMPKEFTMFSSFADTKTNKRLSLSALFISRHAARCSHEVKHKIPKRFPCLAASRIQEKTPVAFYIVSPPLCLLICLDGPWWIIPWSHSYKQWS